MRLSLIVAISENNVIGRAGDLPWHISEDLKRFRRITTGHPIIMGRKNHESIGRLLPDRQNIIITRQKDYTVPGATIVHSLDEAIVACDGEDEAFIIGGADIYALALPYVDRIHLTRVHQTIEGDVYFPPCDWTAFVETGRETYNDPIPHSFITMNRAATGD